VWNNRALEKIFRYEPGELQGHSPRLMHVDDASFEALGKQAYPVLRSGQPYRTQLEMVRKDGSRLWADVSGIELAPGETLWMIVDISTMKADQIRAERLAFHDILTGLPNRALLVDRLRLALPAAERAGKTLVVAFIDLNGFKAVNDTYGHAAGDLLLRAVSGRLQECVRAHDTVARFGGDEFVLLLTQLRDGAEAEAILNRARLAIAQPVIADGNELHVSAAIGSACFPGDGITTPEYLLSTADQRMYEDKQARHQRT
jgi:diguanylate cyclase (GGDEF)-like protein/PAS domain S-box-containing protein